MDPRASLGAPRPPNLQRSITGGLLAPLQPFSTPSTRPSHLNTVRSVSHPLTFPNLPSDGSLYATTPSPLRMEEQELVRSPEAIGVGDDNAEPPAKRAKTDGEDFQSIRDDDVVDETDEADRILPGSPLPFPPAMGPSNKTRATQTRLRLGIEPAARRAHGLDPPAAATKLPPPKKTADFSPWTGNQPEDTLNENVVKLGYFDKAPGTNQAECNSAKPTIASTLHQKNGPGVSLLSYLYTLVLEKRQTLGKCVAPSTFKPPPRVTVTDTKREAWLRDLANPDIPLRKQSRTIPHGIRGKLLMEQCLSKNISLPRAVWLAKCVGANELRAFRRKGVSGSATAVGESKWLLEWTTHVEQFLEDVISSCGQEGWQRRMGYALKLVAAFSSERLLDSRHYLDWLVASFDNTSIQHLPIWIILVQANWNAITAYSRRGRHLAHAILAHLDRASDLGLRAGDQVRLHLRRLVTKLAVADRACLVIPKVWAKYKYLLTSDALQCADGPVRSVFQRNERLAWFSSQTASNTRSPTLELYTHLDAVGHHIDMGALASKAFELIPDPVQLVFALLDWASSLYRVGIARVYLTAAIIAQSRLAGHDTDHGILQYLGRPRKLPVSSEQQIHQVVVELVHLDAFSSGRYLQWLISSGTLVAGASSYATSLIAVLPLNALPSHVLNTRNMLMRRLGYNIGRPTAMKESALHHSLATTDLEKATNMSVPDKLQFSQRICSEVSQKIKDTGISLDEFCQARELVESLDDLRSLVTLVQSSITSESSVILATACDTINLHAKSFAALGHLRTLVDSFSEHYVTLRSQQPLDRNLILAMIRLTQRLPEKATILKLLQDDLTICEQQTSIMVCSPASDSLIGMHATTLDSDAELDAVFASGNTMDDHLMRRVFVRIMQRASDSLPSPPLAPPSRIIGWLDQLRTVDGSEVFERLVQAFLRSIITSQVNVASWMKCVVCLVSSGCLTLSAVALIAREITSSSAAAQVLQLFISWPLEDAGLHAVERCRYRLQQALCKHQHAEDILRLVRVASQGSGFDSTDPDVMAFVIRAVADNATAGNALDKRVVMSILAKGRDVESQDEEMNVQTIVNTATPLSVRFSVEALRGLRSVSPTPRDDAGFAEALLDAFNRGSDVWPQLLEFAGERVNQRIRDWAQEKALYTASGKSAADTPLPSEPLRDCMVLLAVSSKLSPPREDHATVSSLAEKLKELETALPEANDGYNDSRSQHTALLHRLRILVDLTVLQLSTSADGEEDDASQQANAALLTLLCSLTTLPILQIHPTITEQLFDITSTFADRLPEIVLAATETQCSSRTLSDARIRFLLGKTSDDANPPATRLFLASQAPSLQQRILHRQQASQTNARPPTVGAAGAGPSGSLHQRMVSGGSSPGVFPARQDGKGGVANGSGEAKMVPFVVRQWEMIPDSAPVMGENDAALSLRLFGARKV